MVCCSSRKAYLRRHCIKCNGEPGLVAFEWLDAVPHIGGEEHKVSRFRLYEMFGLKWRLNPQRRTPQTQPACASISLIRDRRRQSDVTS